MATIDIRQPLNMLALGSHYGVISSYDSRQITVTAGEMRTRYQGYFSYDDDDVYGQLTGISQTRGGATVFSITGLYLDAYAFKRMWDYGDGDDIMGVVLRGSDRISGSGGSDALLGLSGNDTMLGNAGYDLIDGGIGNDLIDGGQGNDRMQGAAGNDRYVVDSGLDRVVEAVGGGVDLVVASVSHQLAAQVEHLTLTGAAVHGSGNALANRITGTAGHNVLAGGQGADTLIGGTGNDLYRIDAADVIREVKGGGMDRVETAASHALGSAMENLTLIGTAAVNATGNAGANALSGNGAANVLKGLWGDDVLAGHGGKDVLIGGLGDDQLTGGGGADRFVFAWGRDVVTDYQDGLDVIVIDRAALGVATTAEVIDACVERNGDVLLSLAGQALVVRDTTIDALADSLLLQ